MAPLRPCSGHPYNFAPGHSAISSNQPGRPLHRSHSGRTVAPVRACGGCARRFASIGAELSGARSGRDLQRLSRCGPVTPSPGRLAAQRRQNSARGASHSKNGNNSPSPAPAGARDVFPGKAARRPRRTRPLSSPSRHRHLQSIESCFLYLTHYEHMLIIKLS